jgi:RNA polymerase sigma-70 factor, ECF subfamily
MSEKEPVPPLVERARAGDRSAFEALAGAAREGVKGAILSSLAPELRPRIDPEEILQETMLQALQAIGRFEWQGEGSFQAWISGIARNVVQTAIRKRRPSIPLEIAVNVPAADASPSRRAMREERFERLEASFKGLPEAYRTVLTLARLEGLPMNEVAARMGRSPEATRQLLVRALRKLRSRLGHTESIHLPDRRLGGESPGSGGGGDGT